MQCYDGGYMVIMQKKWPHIKKKNNNIKGINQIRERRSRNL